jgi:hypothetical protein
MVVPTIGTELWRDDAANFSNPSRSRINPTSTGSWSHAGSATTQLGADGIWSGWPPVAPEHATRRVAKLNFVYGRRRRQDGKRAAIREALTAPAGSASKAA